MDIEETIKELEIIIETIRNILELDTSEYKEEIYTLDTRQFEALENLLTAYEKEKEKNKELEKQLQSTYQKQYINDLEAINHSNVSFN